MLSKVEQRTAFKLIQEVVRKNNIERISELLFSCLRGKKKLSDKHMLPNDDVLQIIHLRSLTRTVSARNNFAKE